MVLHRGFDVRDAGTAVPSRDLHPCSAIRSDALDKDLAVASVLEDVPGQLGDGRGDALAVRS